MAEERAVAARAPRRLHWHWLVPVLFRPKKTMAEITASSAGVWLTPLLILTVTMLANVLVAGWLRQVAASMGELQLPPGFEYYTPEQQAQIMQALQATSGPVFLYVFPAMVGLLKVWGGWLLVGSLVHLTMTLLGARGETGVSFNLVAWAGVPFALRDLVQTAAMLVTQKLIQSPGLSGFVTQTGEWQPLLLAAFLALIDIYLIWNLIILISGARQSSGIAPGKAVAGIIVTMVIVLAAQALIAFAGTQLSGLEVIRPFF